MGKKSKQKTPVVNPADVIRANEEVNRVGVSNPFGSQTYTTGANGQRMLNTSISPEMQALLTQQMNQAQRPASQYQLPQGQNQLLADSMNRMRARFQPPPDGGP